MKKASTIIPFVTCIIYIFWGCTHNQIEVTSEKVISPTCDINPTLNVYIENSGSMDGYMCDGSQLKDAIFDYISDLNEFSKKTNLYYINSKSIPFNESLEQYIKTLNHFTFQKAGGDRSNSNIGLMIDSILENANDSTVNIFVSDCILDLPAINSQKFLNTCQISIKNAINEGRKRTPNLSVEILKMTSDFNGKYFYPNGSAEILKDVKRPYYIWIFGDNNVLAKLNSEVPFSRLKKYGLEESVSFSKTVSIPYDIKNMTITSSIINPIKGNYYATIRADFRATLQPESTIQNPSNYSFTNPDMSIKEIKTIKDINSQYTHYLTCVIPCKTRIMQENIVFNPPKTPNWVSESNDESGLNIRNNLTKTTGIKHLIEGVADSYKNDISTSFKFNIKRK